MQRLQEVDAHGRLRGRGAPELTEREANQIVAVGLLDEHHTATSFVRALPAAEDRVGATRRVPPRCGRSSPAPWSDR